MADHACHRDAFYCAATLAALAVRHYGYYLAPPELRGHVYNLLTAALLFVAVALVAVRVGGWLVWPAGWWLAEEMMIVGCTGWYLIAPWPQTGDQCSSLVGADLALVGAAVVAALALKLTARMH